MSPKKQERNFLKMKRTLSFILAFAMVATIALTLFVGVGAAKDGDVLFEANFASTSGNYKPDVIYSTLAGDENPVTITPYNNGKSAKFAFTEAAKGSYAWGGAVEGLAVNNSTRYTVDVVFKTNAPNDNSGVTFLMDTAEPTDATNVKQTWTEKGWQTFYGKTSSTFCLNTSGTSSDGFGWITHNQAFDADGYATFKFEVYGYNVFVYTLQADGNFVLTANYRVKAADQDKANIACGMFAYVNAGSTTELDVKSFKVTQGCAIQQANIDKAVAANKAAALASTYASAKKGALVWSANFNGDASFAPTAAGSVDTRLDTVVGVSADGKELTLTGSTYEAGSGGTAGKYFYAAPIKGLSITKDTEYTVEFKIKNDKQYGGGIFACTEADLPNSYISFYGGLQVNEDGTIKDASWTVARGGSTSAYTAGKQMEAKYLKFEAAVLTDGYFDVKVEIDGFDVTVYCKGAEGYVELASYTMDTQDATLACGYYNYQPYAKAYLKDFNVYKGLTVTNDYSKLPEEPDTPDVPTGDASIILALIAVISLGGVMVAKKVR